MTAYLCLVTWPDGTEGLLFPRPGNVPIAQTPAQGLKDYDTACEHLREFAKLRPELKDAKVRLVLFQSVGLIAEFSLSSESQFPA